MPIKDYSIRTKEILRNLGIPDATIVKDTKLTKSTISHLMTEAQDASIKTIIAVLDAYPQINANYILTGRGSMFLDNIESSENSEVLEINRSNQDLIIKLQAELRDAYEEIGRLNMELNKKARRH